MPPDDEVCCSEPVTLPEWDACEFTAVCDPCELDARFVTASRIVEAARLSLEACGIDTSCHRTWVEAQQVTVPPTCCEAIAVAILPPLLPVDRPLGECFPASTDQFELSVTRCRVTFTDDGGKAIGCPDGSEADTVNGEAAAGARDLAAIEANLWAAYCCLIDAEDRAGGPCPCDRHRKLRVVRVERRPRGRCIGWSFLISGS